MEVRLAQFHVPIGEGCEPTIEASQHHEMEGQDVMRVYRRALGELPERTRDVFLLHRVDELSYREIGEKLGIAIPTVQYHVARALAHIDARSEEHTSELQSLMRISYAVFCLKKKKPIT